MLYQLPNGGTIRINEEMYFRLSDAEFEKYIMYVRGSEINDPFHDSVLEDDPTQYLDDETYLIIKADEIPKDVDPKEFLPDDLEE